MKKIASLFQMKPTIKCDKCNRPFQPTEGSFEINGRKFEICLSCQKNIMKGLVCYHGCITSEMGKSWCEDCGKVFRTYKQASREQDIRHGHYDRKKQLKEEILLRRKQKAWKDNNPDCKHTWDVGRCGLVYCTKCLSSNPPPTIRTYGRDTD